MPSESEGRLAPEARATAFEQRRARLLAATVEVGGERGWDGLTLREVVARAGLSKRAVYDHFEDKLACFLAAAREVIGRVTKLVLTTYRDARTPRDGIDAGVGALLGFCGHDPHTARFYLVETAAAGPAGVELWREHMDAMTERADCALGELRRDLPAHSGSMAVGGIYMVAQARVLAGRARELPGLAPTLTASLWKTLGLR